MLLLSSSATSSLLPPGLAENTVQNGSNPSPSTAIFSLVVQPLSRQLVKFSRFDTLNTKSMFGASKDGLICRTNNML
ncbi:hypothetical protein COO60DRAFT_1543552 [Scenedesmus sp. NREL 46B-D3]|nr:hypothetical protein COO60DRAFT_1543552 [Scenedesmus sp. NREL 46B-D3]